MLMRNKEDFTVNWIACLNKLLYKHCNLGLWGIGFYTRRKNNDVLCQFQFRELFIFIFRAMIKYRCFHRFSINQKELKEIIMKIKRL